MAGSHRVDDARPIDLHAHSTASDGTESPAEVVRQAARAGLGTLALTDHDTTDGWAEAGPAAVAAGLTLIPGIEFSTQIGPASVHILGYLIDPRHEPLRAELDAVRTSRVSRAERMVGLIGEDYPLTWEDVRAEAAAGATLGRPHIADALVRKGLATDRSAAFVTILHWQGGYFVPHHAPSPIEAIRLIRSAGGVPVIAHPGSRGSRAMAPATFDGLVAAGLAGVEIGHRENSARSRATLAELAERHGLIVTGSSDYHGRGKPNRLGEYTTEPDQLARIIESATGSEPIFPD